MTPVADGSFSFRGGQHDGILPDRIGPEQYRRGVNLTTKGGGLGPRPGLVHQEIVVTTEGSPIEGGLSYSKIFELGKFQAAASYDADGGMFIVVVISGILFRIDPRVLEAEVIPLGEESSPDRMNQFRRRIPWSYAGRFLVFYDYPNQNVILDNRDARRASTDRESFPGVPLPEVPVSTLGVYLNNRLFVANDGHEFGAGDPTGGINEDAPITFEESLAPAGAFNGDFYSLGSHSSYNAITAMGFLQVQDTATGVGTLLVGTRNSVYAYRSELPRVEWANVQFGRLVLYNAGFAGPRCMTNVNSDMMFHSGDGQIRSLILGQSQQVGQWVNAPISREVSPFLQERENKELIDIAFAGNFMNRVFFSTAPYQVTARTLDGSPIADYAHRGMVVMELDNVSSMTSQASPAWAGLWNGINPMEVIALDDAVYFMSKDQGGVNRLYRMDESISWDVFKGKERQITCRLYTKEYDFNQRLFDKENLSIDYNLSDIRGELSMLVEYKANHIQKWAKWKQFNHCAQTKIYEADCLEKLPDLAPHAFKDLNFGDPEEEECDPITEDLSTVFRKVQLRVTITARTWRLEEIRLRAESIDETKTSPTATACDSIIENTLVSKGCDRSDWEIYKVAA